MHLRLQVENTFIYIQADIKLFTQPYIVCHPLNHDIRKLIKVPEGIPQKLMTEKCLLRRFAVKKRLPFNKQNFCLKTGLDENGAFRFRTNYSIRFAATDPTGWCR